MNRLDELALKLLDQTIEEPELRELEELTERANDRAALLRLMVLESYLHASGRFSVADRVLDQIQQERCRRAEEGVMRAVSELNRPTPRRGQRLRSRVFSRVAFAVMCLAAIGLSAVFVNGLADREIDRVDVIAYFHPHGSTVRILDEDGNARLNLSEGNPTALGPNEIVETQRAIDTGEIIYPDGTRIELLGETRIQLPRTSDGAKEIAVLSGLIQADVVPQPDDQPLRIVTREATLEVLGTSLGVEVREDSTQLEVAVGRVAMTRKADGQRVEVEAGQFATATKLTGEPLRSHPFPDLPREWSEDFEVGLPPGWVSGKLAEHRGDTSVRAVRSRRTANKRFVITSQNAWREGRHALCEIDKNSVLHLRFRQSTFARITIMIGTRSYPPASGRVGKNLFYTKRSWNENLPENTWKTISVPLRNASWVISRGKRMKKPETFEGLATYLIHITTMQRNAGLEVDRIWITNERKGYPQ